MAKIVRKFCVFCTIELAKTRSSRQECENEKVFVRFFEKSVDFFELL